MAIEEFDSVVEQALERGQDPEEALRYRTTAQFDPPEVECSECGHPVSGHGPNGCEHDRSIRSEGIQIDGECGCKEHVISDRLQRLLQRAYESVAVVLLLLAFAGFTRADSIKVVAQEIKADSVIPMSMNVADELASNLLSAQAASPWLHSLDLSIDSLLRAILIYDYQGGPQQITESCCIVVWAQSTIAIDPNVSVTITPSSINFGDVPVSTPEPTAVIMLIAGLGFLLAFRRK